MSAEMKPAKSLANKTAFASLSHSKKLDLSALSWIEEVENGFQVEDDE